MYLSVFTGVVWKGWIGERVLVSYFTSVLNTLQPISSGAKGASSYYDVTFL